MEVEVVSGWAPSRPHTTTQRRLPNPESLNPQSPESTVPRPARSAAPTRIKFTRYLILGVVIEVLTFSVLFVSSLLTCSW